MGAWIAVAVLAAAALFEWKENQSTAANASAAPTSTAATLSSLGSLVSQIASSITKGAGGGGSGGGLGSGGGGGSSASGSTSDGGSGSYVDPTTGTLNNTAVENAYSGLDANGDPITFQDSEPTLTDTIQPVASPVYSIPPVVDDGSGEEYSDIDDSDDDDYDDYGD